MKRLWKKIIKWFGKEEVLELVEEPVVEKRKYCYNHNRFKKSCPDCQSIIK